MRLHIPAAMLVISLCSNEAHGQTDFDELTPCAAANRAFKSHDDSKLRQVSQFITHVLEKLDRDYGVVGQAAILNDGLTEALVAATRGACAQHQGSAISIEARNVYRDLRILYSGGGSQF
jgi:hypothetical protein